MVVVRSMHLIYCIAIERYGMTSDVYMKGYAILINCRKRKWKSYNLSIWGAFLFVFCGDFCLCYWLVLVCWRVKTFIFAISWLRVIAVT